MTALLITLGLSLVLFLGSLIIGLSEGKDTNRYYQYLMANSLHLDKTPMHACFDRAARRPARILGTFIF